eukprot:6351421-Amphidinium_carterae.1
MASPETRLAMPEADDDACPCPSPPFPGAARQDDSLPKGGQVQSVQLKTVARCKCVLGLPSGVGHTQ